MSDSESLTTDEEDDEKKDPNYVDWKNMENIRVICRFRPINSREIREEKSAGLTDHPPIIDKAGRCVKVVREGIRASAGPMEFYLDKILGSTTTQHSLYLNVGKPMVEACLEGYNTTIFAYGQTGSGKTYTMFGPEKLKSNNELGCVQRALSFLFTELNNRKDKKTVTEWKVLLHFVQLYREKLMDLLEPDKGIGLKIRYDPRTDSPYVPNLKQVDVIELGEVIKLLSVANRNRITDKTLMNAESSRSHMIMTLTIEQTLSDGTVKKSKLNFADLAGSETYEKAIGGARGPIDRKKVEELKTINLSLTNLTTCINYLSKGRKASYRSSQLTFYLMDSLGGNSKTTLVVAASPHIFNRSETIRTLRFAKTAKSVKNNAKVNKELSKAQLIALVKKLQRENKKLKAKLALFEAELIKNDIELPIESETSRKKNKKHKRAKSMKSVLSTSATPLSGETFSIKAPISTNKSNKLLALNERRVDESAYNKLKAQLKSFQDELTQQEDEASLLREQLAKKNVELDGLSEEIQASRNLSSQFTKLQESKKQLALQLQSKNEELGDIEHRFDAEREEYRGEKLLLEEELNEFKSDVAQYESIMDNMKLSNQQLKTEANSLRDTINSLQEKMKNIKKNKDKNKKAEKEKEKDKHNKANEILSKYFTVANIKDIEMNDKQLNDTESKIEQLSQNIINVTQAYEQFTGHNFSLDPYPITPITPTTPINGVHNPPPAFGVMNDNDDDHKKDRQEKPKIKKNKSVKTIKPSSAIQNRMAMFGGGRVHGTPKKKSRKAKTKNKAKEYTDSIVKIDPKKNIVFQTERLTHYLSSAMTTIDKQKKLHSEELQDKMNKQNNIIRNLSVENKGLKKELENEINSANTEISALKKQIEDLKLASQNAMLSQNMKENMDEAEDDLFGFDDQIAYLSNIGKGLYDENDHVQPTQLAHNPTQLALWRQHLHIGSKLDCLDEACLWWTSSVRDSDGYRILVRYDGFDARWDEWVDRGSTRIAPYMNKARGGRESKGVSVNLKVVATKKDKRTGRTRRIYKQGFLVKQGKRFKSYKTRYFTLMDDGTMDYFKRMTDQTPAGTFNIRDMMETRRIAYPKKKDLYGFEIVTKKRTWRFQAHSDDVVADWIGVIHAVSKGVEPDDDNGQQTVIYSGYIKQSISTIYTNGGTNAMNGHIQPQAQPPPIHCRHSRGLSIQEESSSHPPINRAGFSLLMDSPVPVDNECESKQSDTEELSVPSNNKSRAEETVEISGSGQVEESDEFDIQHSGWMHKAGKWDANWTYRYCILTGEPVTLRCFVAPKKKETHCIKFKDVKSCIELKKNSDKFGQLEIPTAFAFQLITSTRIYTFACKSRHDVNVWLKKIRKVVDVSSSANTAKYTKRSSMVKFGSTLNKLGTSFGRLIGVTQEHVTTTEVLKTENVQIQKDNTTNTNPSKGNTQPNLSPLSEWNNINVNTMGINGLSGERRASLPILSSWSSDNLIINPLDSNVNHSKPGEKGRRKSAPDLRALKNPQFMRDLVSLENEFKDNMSKSGDEMINNTLDLKRRNSWDRNHMTDNNQNSNIDNKSSKINENIAAVLQSVKNENDEIDNDIDDDNNNETSNDSDEELSLMDT